jgi:hypothetical protein
MMDLTQGALAVLPRKRSAVICGYFPPFSRARGERAEDAQLIDGVSAAERIARADQISRTGGAQGRPDLVLLRVVEESLPLERRAGRDRQGEVSSDGTPDESACACDFIDRRAALETAQRFGLAVV